MAGNDSKLTKTLLTLALTLLTTVGSCVGHDLYARVNTLEQDDKQSGKDTATIQQNLKDFRASFEDFKKDVQEDIKRHHNEK